MLTNYSYRDQLRDYNCRSTVPRWFRDVNHNKGKTNILRTSHVSLWGLSACLCTTSMKGSHLLLFPLSPTRNKPFCFCLFNLGLPLAFLGGWMYILELLFWWKTPESEDSLVSHITNEGDVHHIVSLLKEKRLKVWASSKNRQWLTFFIFLSSSSISSYRGFPSTCALVLSASWLFCHNHFECVIWPENCRQEVAKFFWVFFFCVTCQCVCWYFRNKQNVSGKEPENQKLWVTFSSQWLKTVCEGDFIQTSFKPQSCDSLPLTTSPPSFVYIDGEAIFCVLLYCLQVGALLFHKNGKKISFSILLVSVLFQPVKTQAV